MIDLSFLPSKVEPAARLRSMRGEKRQPKLFSGKPSLSAATPFEREVEGTLCEGRKEKRGGGEGNKSTCSYFPGGDGGRGVTASY